VVLVGLTWAFFQHLCTGIRHFVLDIGAGYELESNARWSVLTIVISVVISFPHATTRIFFRRGPKTRSSSRHPTGSACREDRSFPA